MQMFRNNKIIPIYFLLFLSCSQSTSTEQGKLNKKETAGKTKSNHDSLPFVRIENDIYNLSIVTDSLDHIHSNPTIITLKKSGEIVVSKSVSFSTFSDSLYFLKNDPGTQMSVQYDYVRSNRLYFLAKYKSQRVNISDTIMFAIFFRTDKKGRLDYWHVR